MWVNPLTDAVTTTVLAGRPPKYTLWIHMRALIGNGMNIQQWILTNCPSVCVSVCGVCVCVWCVCVCVWCVCVCHSLPKKNRISLGLSGKPSVLSKDFGGIKTRHWVVLKDGRIVVPKIPWHTTRPLAVSVTQTVLYTELWREQSVSLIEAPPPCTPHHHQPATPGPQPPP